MAAYKETPRQKMIAMMYLVLYALLALNVSKSVLDAFLVVNKSMEVTNKNFQNKINASYADFEKQYQINQNKVRPYWEKAKKARKLSNDMINYINNIKVILTLKVDRLKNDTTEAIRRSKNIYEVKAKDDYDITTNYFIGDSPDGSKGKARELKNKINKYREDLTNLIEPKYRSSLNIGLKTKGEYTDSYGNSQNWEMHNFNHTIYTADIVILNKIIAEIQNAETDVVNQLYSSVYAENFKFDKIEAKVLPKTNYCFLNEDYQAEILVAGYDTKQNPEVLVLPGADTITKNNIKFAKHIKGVKGFVKLILPSNSEGFKQFAGVIKIKSPTGKGVNSYYFHDSYYVAKPSLTVSAKKMNVFYIGVDNPVSISVPGIAVEQLRPRISGGGTLKFDTKSRDYIVRIPKNAKNKAVISVDAKFNGTLKSMGSAEFRVKRLPNPNAYIANKKEGLIDKNVLLAAGAIIPQMPPGFEFNFNFIITSFTFTTSRGGDIIEKKTKGNKFTPEMIKLIRSSKKGQRIWLENIIAKGPDGNRSLSPINLKIN